MLKRRKLPAALPQRPARLSPMSLSPRKGWSLLRQYSPLPSRRNQRQERNRLRQPIFSPPRALRRPAALRLRQQQPPLRRRRLPPRIRPPRVSQTRVSQTRASQSRRPIFSRPLAPPPLAAARRLLPPRRDPTKSRRRKRNPQRLQWPRPNRWRLRQGRNCRFRKCWRLSAQEARRLLPKQRRLPPNRRSPPWLPPCRPGLLPRNLSPACLHLLQRPTPDVAMFWWLHY